MATEYGQDVSTYTLNDEGELDLDPLGQPIDGPLAVAENVARGTETAPGDLPWAKDEGCDIARYQNADLSPAQVLALSGEVEDDAKRDERVAAVDVQATFDEAARKLSVQINGETSDGPFKLVLSSDDLSIAAIQAGGGA